ncbi:MAG: OmpA family protein [Deltaproteobacteria bacterium]|nr:OmpA family protein [Deltaproteobacteria bacterium]
MNSNRFVPSLGNDGLVGVSSSETMGHLNFAIKTIFGYAGNPLQAMLDEKSTLEACASQFRFDVLLCVGFSDFFDICGQPPVPLFTASCGGVDTLGNVPKVPGTSIGDVRVMPRVNLPILRNRVLAQVKRLNKRLYGLLTEFGQVGKMVAAAKKKVAAYKEEVDRLRGEAEGVVRKVSQQVESLSRQLSGATITFLERFDGGVAKIPSLSSLADGGVPVPRALRDWIEGKVPAPPNMKELLASGVVLPPELKRLLDGGMPGEALCLMGMKTLEREKALRLAQIRRRLGAIEPIYRDAIDVYRRFEERRQRLLAMVDELKKSITALAPRTPTGVGFGFVPEFTLPTATDNANAGEPGMTFTPKVLLDYRWANGSFFGTNLAFRLRPETVTLNIHAGNEILLGVGGNFRLHPRWDLVAEAQFALGVAGGAFLDQVSLEGTVGGTHRFCSGFFINASYGRGVLTNWGTPDQRITAGFGYGPKPDCPVETPRDRDADGVPDVFDVCPSVAGARVNGCPEPPLPPKVPPADPELEPDPEPVVDVAPPPQPETAPKLLPEPEPPPPAVSLSSPVAFATARAVLLRISHPELRRIAEQLRLFPNLRLRIIGHSDARGIERQNVRLSRQRAEAVRRFFVREGIAAERIIVEGKGSAEPLEKRCEAKKSGAAREKCYTANRQIEIAIVE